MTPGSRVRLINDHLIDHLAHSVPVWLWNSLLYSAHASSSRSNFASFVTQQMMHSPVWRNVAQTDRCTLSRKLARTHVRAICQYIGGYKYYWIKNISGYKKQNNPKNTCRLSHSKHRQLLSRRGTIRQHSGTINLSMQTHSLSPQVPMKNKSGYWRRVLGDYEQKLEYRGTLSWPNLYWGELLFISLKMSSLTAHKCLHFFWPRTFTYNNCFVQRKYLTRMYACSTNSFL